jgi:hypothetical protein
MSSLDDFFKLFHLGVTMPEKETGPQVVVEQVSAARGASPGHWSITWEVQNKAGRLRILSGRLPHGRFRCGEIKLTPAPVLGSSESVKLEFTVECEEPPGAIVENAFLILRVDWPQVPWLILARLRVSAGENGAPQSVTEAITAQPVGFSAAMK